MHSPQDFTHVPVTESPEDKAMTSDDGLSQLDDFTLLLQRQEAADNHDAERLTALDAEVARRVIQIRATLGGGR